MYRQHGIGNPCVMHAELKRCSAFFCYLLAICTVQWIYRVRNEALTSPASFLIGRGLHFLKMLIKVSFVLINTCEVSFQFSFLSIIQIHSGLNISESVYYFFKV